MPCSVKASSVPKPESSIPDLFQEEWASRGHGLRGVMGFARSMGFAGSDPVMGFRGLAKSEASRAGAPRPASPVT